MVNVGLKHTNVENSSVFHPILFKTVEWNVELSCFCLNDFCLCKVYPNRPKHINCIGFFLLRDLFLFNKEMYDCKRGSFVPEDSSYVCTMKMFEIWLFINVRKYFNFV